MTKIFMPALALAWLACGDAYAQNKVAAPPKSEITTAPASSAGVVRLGTIETPVTSREKVLAYPRLLSQAMDCEVTGYDFSMVANGKAWGPVTVKGAALNEQIKDKIKDIDPVNVKLSFTNIHVKCGSEEATASPVNIEYNH